MGDPREGTQPSRPGRRGSAATASSPPPPTASCATAWQRADGRDRQGGGRLLRAGALPLRDQGTALHRRAQPHRPRSPTPSPNGHWSGPAPSRRSASPPSSTAACPATSAWPMTGGSGRSSTCCACDSPTLARWASRSTRRSTPASPTSSPQASRPAPSTSGPRTPADRRDRGRPVRRAGRPGGRARARPLARRGPDHGRARGREAGRPRRPAPASGQGLQEAGA